MIRQVYSPKESSLKNSSSGSYCFVAILLVLWFGIFETPTTCAFIVVGGGGGGSGGGGGAYFAKNKRYFCIHPPIFLIFHILTSKMMC